MRCVACGREFQPTKNPYTKAEHPDIPLIQNHDFLCFEHATNYWRAFVREKGPRESTPDPIDVRDVIMEATA